MGDKTLLCKLLVCSLPLCRYFISLLLPITCQTLQFPAQPFISISDWFNYVVATSCGKRRYFKAEIELSWVKMLPLKLQNKSTEGRSVAVFPLSHLKWVLMSEWKEREEEVKGEEQEEEGLSVGSQPPRHNRNAHEGFRVLWQRSRDGPSRGQRLHVTLCIWTGNDNINQHGKVWLATAKRSNRKSP